VRERALWRALWLFAAALAIAVPAPAAPTEQAALDISTLNEGQRLRLAIELAKTGRHEQAAQLIARHPFTGPLAANRTLFVEGLILRGRGDTEGAIAKYRAALADNPSLTLVRAELANALVAVGERDSAKHHLEQLASEAPDENAARQVRSFIDRIDAERPFKVSAYVSLAPSTNVNDGTDNDTIYTIFGQIPISAAGKEKSGIGLNAGLRAGYTQPLGERFMGVVGFGLDGRVYENGDYDRATASESAEIRYLVKDGYVGLGGIASQTVSSDDIDFAAWTAGPRLSVFHRFSPKSSLLAASTAEFKTYEDTPFHDGVSLSENVSFSHAFAQGFFGYVLGEVEYTDTDYKHLDNWSYMIGLGASKELRHGLTLAAGGRARLTKYEGASVLIGKPREDERYDATVSITKRDWELWGYAPVFEYSYTLNQSNIAFFDFDSHTVDFRLTKDF
jgi:tetratricopeptide (TPR) repeat protein